MSLALLGLGTAQPAHAIDQQTMAASAEPCSCVTDKQRKLLPALYRRTRVDRRHSVVVNATNGEAKLPLSERMLAFYPPLPMKPTAARPSPNGCAATPKKRYPSLPRPAATRSKTPT